MRRSAYLSLLLPLLLASIPVAAAPPAPPGSPELHDDFTYGPLRFRVESLALDGSVSAKAKLSIENLTHGVAHVVLASVSAAQNGTGLSLSSSTGAKCDAKDKEISDIKIVASEGETKVRAMTQIQALTKLTFSATFRCNTGRLNTTDKHAIRGRVLTATIAGGFDIPLNFTGLTALAK
jgi:hypothetical protein